VTEETALVAIDAWPARDVDLLRMDKTLHVTRVARNAGSDWIGLDVPSDAEAGVWHGHQHLWLSQDNVDDWVEWTFDVPPPDAAIEASVPPDPPLFSVDEEARRYAPPTPRSRVLFLPLQGSPVIHPVSGLAPGEPPGPEFPAGTVYVARVDLGGIYVTEWNLATGAPRRRTRLDVSDLAWFVRMRRIDDALHVVAWVHRGEMRYVRLSLDLRPVASTYLGESLERGAETIAGDGARTVVLATMDPFARAPRPRTAREILDGYVEDHHAEQRLVPPYVKYVAFALDASGRKLAQRDLPGLAPDDAGFADAIVVGDRSFVIVDPVKDSRRYLLRLRLDRALNIERDIRVDSPTAGFDFMGVTRIPGSDRLSVEGPSSTVVRRALSLAGARLGVDSPCRPDSPGFDTYEDVSLAGEHVTLRADLFDSWIEWSDAPVGWRAALCVGAP
jgi:hypothetical protein